jgi:hypothetical protein
LTLKRATSPATDFLDVAHVDVGRLVVSLLDGVVTLGAEPVGAPARGAHRFAGVAASSGVGRIGRRAREVGGAVVHKRGVRFGLGAVDLDVTTDVAVVATGVLHERGDRGQEAVEVLSRVRGSACGPCGRRDCR